MKSPTYIVWLLVLLACMTLALFWPATGYDFVKLDDDQYICLNSHVTTGLTVANIRWAFTTIYEDWWLPLLWISYMADTELFGPGPFGYHLTNILLHTANVALLFWVLLRMTGSRGASFFVAAFFALHPLRVESVAWIAERKDVLSGLFFFLGLLAYVRHVARPGVVRMGVLLVLMLMGLLSKAILVVLPVLLLLLDYWPLRRAGDPWGPGAWTRWRPLLREKVPLFALALVFIAINLGTHRAYDVAGDGLARFDRLGLIFPNYWCYLGKIFWPSRLSIVYPEHDAVNWTLSIAAAAGLLVLTLLALRLRRKYPYGVVGWLWFLVALFPVIRGVRLGLAAYADRFVYLPAIGLTIALVWGAATLAEKRPPLKIPLVLLAIALLCACAVRSALRLPAWKDSLTAFSDLIGFAPDNFLANDAYGFALLEKGRTEESLAYFARAAQIRPRDTQAPADYADALLRLGRNDEAVAWLQEALATRDPENPILNSLLGFAYLDLNRAELALSPMRKALAFQPRNLGWHIELIRALFEAGHSGAAQEEIRRLQASGYSGFRGFDDLIPFYVNWWRDGEKAHAWHFFQSAIQQRPEHILLLNTAAWLLATRPDSPAPPEEAIRLARRAVELARVPQPLLLDALAAALAANGQYAEAQQSALQAIAFARKNGDLPNAEAIEKRLAAYRLHQPWKE